MERKEILVINQQRCICGAVVIEVKHPCSIILHETSRPCTINNHGMNQPCNDIETWRMIGKMVAVVFIVLPHTLVKYSGLGLYKVYKQKFYSKNQRRLVAWFQGNHK
jgi:hypothetical protein